MRAVSIFVTLLLFHCFSWSQVLIFADASRVVKPMNVALMTFIAETLHVAKPALNLDCDVRIREIKQERKFSDGVHIVEMLELIYHNRAYGFPEQKTFFPLGSVITKSEKNSKFSGVVEQIELQADDMVNSRFIFQHDGRGEIVWMSYEDDLRTVPCKLKN